MPERDPIPETLVRAVIENAASIGPKGMINTIRMTGLRGTAFISGVPRKAGMCSTPSIKRNHPNQLQAKAMR